MVISRRNDTAVVIIQYHKRILILLRGATSPWQPLKWDLPGGTIEAGETAFEAAVRECFEETHLQPWNIHFFTQVMDPEGWTLTVYLAEHNENQEIRLTSEHDALYWVSFEELGRFAFVPKIKALLEDMLA